MKLFVAEDGSEAMIQLVEGTGDHDKSVSALAIVEVRSAIRRRERSGEISTAHAASAVAAIQGEARRLIEVPVSSAVLSRAASLVDIRALRALDAVQLATALIVLEGLPFNANHLFVCSDGKLIEAAQQEGLSTWNPETDYSTV